MTILPTVPLVVDKPKINYSKLWYECVWRLIVFVHFTAILLNILSMVVIPWYQPFYVSVPVISFEFNLILNRAWECPLTIWENKFRVLAGREPIGKFIKHYIVKSIIQLKRKCQ